MRQRSAFTFIEIMITLAILGILAAIFYPMVVDLGVISSARVMQATVRHVREKISLHAVIDPPDERTREGYPRDIKDEWFSSGRLPLHSWTRKPMKVQIVNGPKTARIPNNYTYQVRPDGTSAGHDAWYNAANGSFCAFVPHNGTDAEIRGMFNLINGFNDGEGDPAGRPGRGRGRGGGDDDDDDGDDDDDDDGDDDDDDDDDD